MLRTLITPKSQGSYTNANDHQKVMKTLAEAVRLATISSSGKARNRHLAHDKGKIATREQASRLLPAGSSLRKVGNSETYGLYDDRSPSAWAVAGFDRACACEVIIVSNDIPVIRAEKQEEKGTHHLLFEEEQA